MFGANSMKLAYKFSESCDLLHHPVTPTGTAAEDWSVTTWTGGRGLWAAGTLPWSTRTFLTKWWRYEQPSFVVPIWNQPHWCQGFLGRQLLAYFSIESFRCLDTNQTYLPMTRRRSPNHLAFGYGCALLKCNQLLRPVDFCNCAFPGLYLGICSLLNYNLLC